MTDHSRVIDAVVYATQRIADRYDLVDPGEIATILRCAADRVEKGDQE